VRITCLGCWGPYPPPGGACSCYLVEEGDCRLLLDCGTGALPNLGRMLEPGTVRAVLLTHLHGDHISDLLALRYAVAEAMDRGGRRESLPVFSPAEPAEVRRILPYRDAVRLHELVEGKPLGVGPLLITPYRVEHPVPAYAVRISSSSGSMCYSGDAELCEGLLQAASGADLFICEATWREGRVPAGRRGHLTARQAGEVAARARVARLVLTHLHPSADPEAFREEASSAFGGNVEVAREGESWEVG